MRREWVVGIIVVALIIATASAQRPGNGAGTPGVTGAAGGDLSGTYPNPTVAKLNGIAVTGTPLIGYVPTATSASAATWQATASSLPPSGAAGGSLAGTYPNPTINTLAQNLLFTDATYDIGASGANRPRNIWSSGGLIAGGNSYSSSFHTSFDDVVVSGAGITLGSTRTISGSASESTIKYLTATNCSSSAGPAVCASAAAGSVIIPAAGTDVTVNTTAVTANSQIFAIFDQSLGTKLGVTCNSTTANPHIGARVAGTSFTIHANVSPITNPACFSYFIIN